MLLRRCCGARARAKRKRNKWHRKNVLKNLWASAKGAAFDWPNGVILGFFPDSIFTVARHSSPTFRERIPLDDRFTPFSVALLSPLFQYPASVHAKSPRLSVFPRSFFFFSCLLCCGRRATHAPLPLLPPSLSGGPSPQQHHQQRKARTSPQNAQHLQL